MPIHKRHDTQGNFYQYGDHGAKYYYSNSTRDREDAFHKAQKQAQAIHAHGYVDK